MNRRYILVVMTIGLDMLGIHAFFGALWVGGSVLLFIIESTATPKTFKLAGPFFTIIAIITLIFGAITYIELFGISSLAYITTSRTIILTTIGGVLGLIAFISGIMISIFKTREFKLKEMATTPSGLKRTEMIANTPSGFNTPSGLKRTEMIAKIAGIVDVTALVLTLIFMIAAVVT